jgi:transcriptional regulator with XRE-family HTH domain
MATANNMEKTIH